MAATVSPTPLGGPGRSLRIVRGNGQSAREEGGLKGTYSKGTSTGQRVSPAARAAATNTLGNGVNDEDSSDDEGSAAPVLSAAAEEILGGRSGGSKPSSGTRAGHVKNHAQWQSGSPAPLAYRDRQHHRDAERQRSASPQAAASASPSSKHNIKITRGTQSPESATRKRTKSVNTAGDAVGSPAVKDFAGDYKTPASRYRTYMNEDGEDGSPVGSAERSGSGGPTSVHYSSGKSMGNVSSADGRDGMNQTTRGPGAHGSIRNLRQGGTLLKGRARRGMIRRPSEEDNQSPLQRVQPSSQERYGPASQGDRVHDSPVGDQLPSKVRFVPGSEQRPGVADDVPRPASPSSRPTPGERDYHQPSSSAHRRIQSEGGKRDAHRPVQTDKENDPPSMLGSHRPSPVEVFVDHPVKPVSTSKHPEPAPEQRPALASKTANTPLRPAPPPPKMNVVDAATVAAGAMASKQRKKPTVASMTVNGRRYNRLDCIGRGGSGKVFRVMAENYKLYALKRVSLEGMDEMAIRGFKGEINLLQKLKEVNRVVRLIDYEVNDERQTLTVLMEMGELDLKKLLDPYLDEQTGRFDITFTRYIWREMLECVRAVHEYDVVHSDLKPANFVMVSGRLKLIDFGIANAIADDTVNVHREQQIGTPNYMAPEALVDTNAHERGMIGASIGKLMKLGKPSDVWSLGCILYQIVYGKPPFGHITATHSKVMAIVSDKHPISFPETGLGGAHVPIGLLRALKRCLLRDQRQRPTIDELLSSRDPFLHPDAEGLIPLSEHLLGQIQKTLASRIRDRKGVVPDDGELALWQANMFENVRNAIRDGKVQV